MLEEGHQATSSGDDEWKWIERQQRTSDTFSKLWSSVAHLRVERSSNNASKLAQLFHQVHHYKIELCRELDALTLDVNNLFLDQNGYRQRLSMSGDPCASQCFQPHVADTTTASTAHQHNNFATDAQDNMQPSARRTPHKRSTHGGNRQKTARQVTTTTTTNDMPIIDVEPCYSYPPPLDVPDLKSIGGDRESVVDIRDEMQRLQLEADCQQKHDRIADWLQKSVDDQQPEGTSTPREDDQPGPSTVPAVPESIADFDSLFAVTYKPHPDGFFQDDKPVLCWLTTLHSPLNFYVMPDLVKSTVVQMEASLKTFFEEVQPDVILPKDKHFPGMPCVVRDKAGHWRRAKIETPGESECKVMFVDYGVSKWEPYFRLRPLPGQLEEYEAAWNVAIYGVDSRDVSIDEQQRFIAEFSAIKQMVLIVVRSGRKRRYNAHQRLLVDMINAHDGSTDLCETYKSAKSRRKANETETQQKSNEPNVQEPLCNPFQEAVEEAAAVKSSNSVDQFHSQPPIEQSSEATQLNCATLARINREQPQTEVPEDADTLAPLPTGFRCASLLQQDTNNNNNKEDPIEWSIPPARAMLNNYDEEERKRWLELEGETSAPLDPNDLREMDVLVDEHMKPESMIPDPEDIEAEEQSRESTEQDDDDHDVNDSEHVAAPRMDSDPQSSPDDTSLVDFLADLPLLTKKASPTEYVPFSSHSAVVTANDRASSGKGSPPLIIRANSTPPTDACGDQLSIKSTPAMNKSKHAYGRGMNLHPTVNNGNTSAF